MCNAITLSFLLLIQRREFFILDRIKSSSRYTESGVWYMTRRAIRCWPRSSHRSSWRILASSSAGLSLKSLSLVHGRLTEHPRIGVKKRGKEEDERFTRIVAQIVRRNFNFYLADIIDRWTTSSILSTSLYASRKWSRDQNLDEKIEDIASKIYLKAKGETYSMNTISTTSLWNIDL